ncbi:electron transfer flavoprotein subunit alpha/FixB family protein [Roseburia hominis]
MGYLKIHQEMVTEEIARKMCDVCPFGAISYQEGKLEIGAGCKMCRICVKNGVPGVVTYEEEKKEEIDKSLWKGIAVFAEQEEGRIHPVVYELLGKAAELAQKIQQPVYAVLAGFGVEKLAEELLHYGADRVFCYDAEELEEFRILPYAKVLEDFVEQTQPSVIMVGATMKGRSLAPRAAAHFRTGLTADCTVLDIKENTDLVQIRPAFGGNIMAQIVTPNSRPQFCTVRYKVFAAPERKEAASGSVVRMELEKEKYATSVEVVEKTKKPKEIDIAEAEIIVAVGRGVKSQNDLEMIGELAELLGAQTACTRPLIEAGWFDARRQIGLSGRTVKPKLILTIGISGSVQFAAGMKGSDCIVAINEDKNASIFDVAHYGFVGNLYEIVPRLIEEIRGGAAR